MKSIFTKKIIIIFTVILAIAGGAIILGLAVGNTNVPQIENSNEIVYEKLNQNGDVIYTITKQELYEEMKRNNGVNQLLSLVDEKLLESYLSDISQAEIDKKIQLLQYQTNDQEVIDAYDAETLENLLENFEYSMILSGYHNGQEEEYAKLLIAREKFVFSQISDSDDITENKVAEYYLNSYFEDIQAIRLRFLSAKDATNVLNHFNLGDANGKLGFYLGFSFDDEGLKDLDDKIVEAQITVDTFYFDEDKNIFDLKDKKIYSFKNDIYTDAKDKTYSIDESGNLINDESVVIIKDELIFDSASDARDYKKENTTFYKVVKVGTLIEVSDLNDVLVYKVDGKKIYAAADTAMENDLQDTVTLIFNKKYTSIDKVKEFTTNNTSELTDEEVLKYFIEMYNYIYSDYRDTLDPDASVDDLIALDDEHLSFNFKDVNGFNATLGKFMFSDISQVNDKTYSSNAKVVGDYAYMVFKLSEGEKIKLKELIMDIINSAIILPTTATKDITLITEGPFGSKITWDSGNAKVITNNGTVLTPKEDTLVSLKYKITIFGMEESGVKIVKVPVTGENSAIEKFDENYDSLKTLLNDDVVYAEIVAIILDDMVYGANSRENINTYLAKARKEAKIVVYDFFLSLDYASSHDASYNYKNKGDKTALASIKLANGETYKVTAEDFYERGLDRNPSLMIFYAMQYDEAIQSEHFTTLFGKQKDLTKNSSEYMGYLKNHIGQIKNEYNGLLSNPTYLELYEQYYGWKFDSFQTYLYTRYRVESEKMLLENLVLSELRMSFIKEALDGEDVTDMIYAVVEDNYENFFSLKAEQVLIYFDFDEDGQLDDYNEFYEDLDPLEKDAFDALISQLETLVKDSEKTFKDLVAEYKNAERDHEDWGTFKQKGFILKYESLNPKDGDKVKSLTYSGEYGVKDKYIKEFTDALIALYKEYKNPINEDVDQLVSNLVPTAFGLHIIEVKKGDDFDGISLEIKAEDYKNITDSMLNASEKPSLEQIENYYTYKIYEQFNDLDNVSMANKYGVTLPIIPDKVLTNLDVYAGETLEAIFGSSTVNYAFLLKAKDGLAKSGITQVDFLDNINVLIDIYHEAAFGSLEVK